MKLFWMTHQDRYKLKRAQSFWMTSSSWLMCISTSLSPSKSVHLLERGKVKIQRIQSKEIKLKEENAVHNCYGHYRWDAVVVYLLCTLSSPPVALLSKGVLVLDCVMFGFLLENLRPAVAWLWGHRCSFRPLHRASLPPQRMLAVQSAPPAVLSSHSAKSVYCSSIELVHAGAGIALCWTTNKKW